MRFFEQTAKFFLVVATSGLLFGCGDSAAPPPAVPTPDTPSEPEPADPACDTEAFESTFEAIQEVIFERHDCTAAACHSSAAVGGLDLRPEFAYANLIEVDSVGSRWRRIEPGDKDRSYLWLKLAAKTLPDEFETTGTPMPSGDSALSEDELEGVRLWIYSGAPETGTVAGTETLFDACLPEPEPIIILPLEPPAPGEGVQFVMPPVRLPAASEQEVCFATYYDFREQVPDWALDPSGRYFRFSGQELRQDPQSHHLVLIHADVDIEGGEMDHPSFGTWTCGGGERDGEVCDPLDIDSCGEQGFCHSEIDPVSLGCLGYGPPEAGGLGIVSQQIGGAQEAQAYISFREGVFGQMPTHGVAYWSSHSFNLTSKDTRLRGRINFPFATQTDYPLQQIFNVERVFGANAAPFTEQTICHYEELPQGARLFGITSHTHERGKHFWAELLDGTLIYENFIYNDPVKQFFEPALEFDSPDPADRRILFCATYNNGLGEGGFLDVEAVTRSSRVPESARLTMGACEPVACVAGKVGAACDGSDDNASCDSEPGKGDGFCDACNITGGESTENEMFILLGQYYIDPAYPQPSAEGPVFAGLASLPRTDDSQP